MQSNEQSDLESEWFSGQTMPPESVTSDWFCVFVNQSKETLD